MFADSVNFMIFYIHHLPSTIKMSIKGRNDLESSKRRHYNIKQNYCPCYKAFTTSLYVHN
uniref:Ovule protein n=1 Tax=Heterorhabditis bacteriophora TaxID=37862 RepID=A0A1I7WCB0_HETBA